MDSYQLGVLTGQIVFWIIFLLIIWGMIKFYKMIFLSILWSIVRVYNKIIQKLFPNPTKELLKTYLFWENFVNGISSTDELKKKLKTIKSTKVYKDEFHHFYLTPQEATALNIVVKEISIKEVLDSQIYPLILLSRLAQMTLYTPDDLKNITETSQMIWLTLKDTTFHMILDKDKLVYPKDYPVDNPFRFGYQIFLNEKGLLGIYDVEADLLVLPFEYQYIKTYGNIAIISKDKQEYFSYDLITKQIISSVSDTTTISKDLKEKIDLSKIELKAYLELIPTLLTQSDLVNCGLWHAKVWVMKVPSDYEEIIEDSSFGIIEWNQYCSADIFDMSIELPVNFKKKNGDYVSIGIEHKYLILDKEYRKNLKLIENKSSINTFTDLLVRGNLPDDDRVVPNYLKIKNSQYDDVDFSNNKVDEIVKLSSEEFNELVSLTDNGLLFTWLGTLSIEELQKFYKYNKEIVKLANTSEIGAKEQFENAMATINKDEITNTQRARATLEMPLMIEYAKNLYLKTISFRMFRTYDYFKEYENEIDARFEITLSNIIWEDMQYIPDYFEQVLKLYRDAYDENSEYHQKIFEHLAKRFGYLIFALAKLIELLENKTDSSIHWFVEKALDKEIISTKIELNVDEINTLQSDKKLIDFLTLMFVSICAKNDDTYMQSIINVTKTLFEWYVANDKACEYAMVEMMKSFALKEVNVENANAFLEFFEKLPKLYKELSFKKIMELKELINTTLANFKPQDNKIFEKEGVKNKLILLNYLVDVEDLFV